MMQSTRSSVTTEPAPDAVAHARRAGRLDADDPDRRLDVLDRHRDAGDQPAAADRHDDDVDLGPVADDLEAERALAGDELQVVERMHVGEAAIADQLLRLLVGLVPDRAVQHDLRAVAARRRDLRRRGVLGHHDDGLDAVDAARRARRPARGCRPTSRRRRGAVRRSVSCVNLLSGPRILYDPVRWNISALSRTSKPVRSLSDARRQERRVVDVRRHARVGRVEDLAAERQRHRVTAVIMISTRPSGATSPVRTVVRAA